MQVIGLMGPEVFAYVGVHLSMWVWDALQIEVRFYALEVRSAARFKSKSQILTFQASKILIM